MFASAIPLICSGFVTSKNLAVLPIVLNECFICESVPPYSSDAAMKLSPACMNVSSAVICAHWPDATASEFGSVAALSKLPCALHGAPSSFATLYSKTCVVGLQIRV